MATFHQISGSVLAMTAAGALPVAAQDALSGFTLDVKGGYGLSNTNFEDKLGDEGSEKLGIDEQVGFTGSARLKRSFSPVLDYSVGVSGNFLSDSSDKVGDDGSDTFEANFDDRFNSFAFDADVGWNTTMGTTPVRLFGGIRALRTNLSTSTDIETPTDFIEIDKVGKFSGYGPRVGVEAADRIGSGNFGWSGSLAGAALFGTIDSEFEIDSSGGPSGSESIDTDETVLNLDASLGVDWYLSDSSKVSVGYQLQKFWNVNDEDAFDETDKLVQGAYLGFTTNF